LHAKDLQLLRASIGHNVILCCTDGEVIVAEIYSVSEEDEDIIYDVVSTNRPDASRERAAYLMPFSEVSSVEPEQGEAR
jgi:hypothetical protein